MLNIQRCTRETVKSLCEQHHAYGSVNIACVYAFAVYEENQPVAAFSWQPPAPGTAKTLAPSCPASVLALSRMVAVPRTERKLRHISKPLKFQMHKLIDRGRWPVLVTYSDASLGHTGHVYKCSGWKADGVRKARYFTDANGIRVNAYCSGRMRIEKEWTRNHTLLTRWIHRACPEGQEAEHLAAHGWIRQLIPGRTWKSGQPAAIWVQEKTT